MPYLPCLVNRKEHVRFTNHAEDVLVFHENEPICFRVYLKVFSEDIFVGDEYCHSNHIIDEDFPVIVEFDVSEKAYTLDWKRMGQVLEHGITAQDAIDEVEALFVA